MLGFENYQNLTKYFITSHGVVLQIYLFWSSDFKTNPYENQPEQIKKTDKLWVSNQPPPIK